MPRLAVELPDVYDNVTRPVVLGVTRALIDRLSIPADSKVQFNGAIGQAIQQGSRLSDNPMSPPASFPFTTKVKVEMQEEYIEDRTLTEPIMQKGTRVVFADQELGVFLKPIYTPSQITISFRYRAEDRIDAERWRDELRRKSGEGRAELLHELNYHYVIPPEYQILLYRFHQMRENVAGYGEDLTQYFRDHFTSRATTITDQVGQNRELAISEVQYGVMGWFDFVAQPANPEVENQAGSWEAGFDYTFQFDKVTAMAMQFPISIHNQLVDAEFAKLDKPYTLSNLKRRAQWGKWVLDEYTPIQPVNQQLIEGVVVPDYDDWLPQQSLSFERNVFTALVGVNLEDLREVLNLGQLGTHQLTPTVLHHMQRWHQRLNHPRAALFNVALYQGTGRMGAESLSIDSDLNVRTTFDLDPRKVYHLRITVVDDFSVLPPDVIDDLLDDPDLVEEVLDAIDDGEGYTGGLQDNIGKNKTCPPKCHLRVIGGRRITRASMNKVLGELSRKRTGSRGYTTYAMKTVMQGTVIAHRGKYRHADFNITTPEPSPEVGEKVSDCD